MNPTEYQSDPLRVVGPSDLKRLGHGDPSTNWRARQRGEFPQPDFYASGKPRWFEATIVAHLRALAERQRASACE